MCSMWIYGMKFLPIYLVKMKKTDDTKNILNFTDLLLIIVLGKLWWWMTGISRTNEQNIDQLMIYNDKINMVGW